MNASSSRALSSCTASCDRGRRPRVVLLGIAGGTTTWSPRADGRPARHGISTAVVVGDRIYVVDQGAGSTRQLTIADPLGRGRGSVLRDLGALLITHLHSDHIVDLPCLLHWGREQGWPPEPVPLIGPGPLPLSTRAYAGRRAGIATGGAVRPGTASLVKGLVHAFRADTIDRVLGAGRPPLEDLVRVREVPVPGRDETTAGSAPVLEDANVRVSATLVEHGDMAPAYAYRFDFDGGAVVISGDTGPCDALVELAVGADVLVHEAISPHFAASRFGAPPYDAAQQQSLDHVFAKHTSVRAVGDIAARAGVPTLVLTHLVPGDLPADAWRDAVTGFDGQVIVGEDLDVVPVQEERPPRLRVRRPSGR